MNRPGARVVAGVVARMEVHLLEARHAGAPQALLARAGGRHGQAQHAHHRRGLYPAKLRRASGDGLGRHPALAIRRARERQHGVLSRHHVRHFDHVADRPDVRIGRAHLRIDDDAAARTDLEAGRLGQLGLGSHADGEDDEIGWKTGAALRDHDQAAVSPLVDAGQPVAEMELHALRDQVLHEWDRDLRIERGHDLRQLFQHGHGESAMDQVLDHLQSDESAADDDRGAGAAIGNPGTNTAGVRNVAHREDARQVHARQRWPDRRRARRQDQRVVTLRAAVAGVEVAHD